MRCGIPSDELRCSLWKKIVESDGLSKKFPKLYEKLYLQEDKFKIKLKIKKDISRTFPQFEYFQNEQPG